MNLKWETPRPAKRVHEKTREYDAITTALQERPGEWALIHESYGRNQCPALTSRGVQVSGRRCDDGTYTIYARWPDA